MDDEEFDNLQLRVECRDSIANKTILVFFKDKIEIKSLTVNRTVYIKDIIGTSFKEYNFPVLIKFSIYKRNTYSIHFAINLLDTYRIIELFAILGLCYKYFKRAGVMKSYRYHMYECFLEVGK